MKTQWLVFSLRVILGLIFLVSSITKLSSQSQFVNEVISYGLLPHPLAWLYGTTLPWVELLTGTALILGIFAVPALVLCILMALSFAIANTYALAQGLADRCGSCFGQLIPLDLNIALDIDLAIILAAVLALVFRRMGDSINLGNFFLTWLKSKIIHLPAQSIPRIGPVALLLVIGLAVGLPLSLGKNTSPVYTNIDLSLEQGKPVLLTFFMAGCGECEQQRPVIDELEQLYRDSISFISIDYKVESAVALDFGVTGVPTILLIDKKEQKGYSIPQRFVHLTSREQIQSSLYDKLSEDIISKKYGPLAEFSASPTSGRVPIKVQFNDLSLGEAGSWSWDFDNDGIIDSRNQNPTHVFDKPGDYTVSLTVAGEGGSSTRSLQEYLHIKSKGCLADFYADPVSVDGTKPIKFYDQSKSEDEIVAWEWDFDADGVVDSTESNPAYTYTKNGVFSVSLTVRTSICEDKITRSDYISVKGCGG